MRRLGTLERIGQGRGIVRMNDAELPSIGQTVVDESLSSVGTVIDIIGPTDAPLVVVDPGDSVDLVEHIGERLYLRGKSHQS